MPFARWRNHARSIATDVAPAVLARMKNAAPSERGGQVEQVQQRSVRSALVEAADHQSRTGGGDRVGVVVAEDPHVRAAVVDDTLQHRAGGHFRASRKYPGNAGSGVGSRGTRQVDADIRCPGTVRIHGERNDEVDELLDLVVAGDDRAEAAQGAGAGAYVR